MLHTLSMEIRHLETFRTVATTGSFTRAAEVLHYAQSTVSAHIQHLERELGAQLFDRLGHTIALTSAARRLLPYAERILGLAEEARNGLMDEDGEPAGTVVFSAPETVAAYRLPRALARLRDRHPSIKAEQRFVPYARIAQELSDGRIDVGFFLQEPIQSKRLEVETLAIEGLAIVMSPDHPLAQTEFLIGAQSVGFTLILTEPGCGYRHLIQQALRTAGITPESSLEFDSVQVVKQMVRAGLGIGFLPLVAIEDELAEGSLAIAPWFETGFRTTLQAAWHGNRWLSPHVKTFVEVCRRSLSGGVGVLGG